MGKGGGNGKGKIERLEQNKGNSDKEGQRSEGKKGKWEGRKGREGHGLPPKPNDFESPNSS